MGMVSSAIMLQLFETCSDINVAKDPHEFLHAVCEDEHRPDTPCASKFGNASSYDGPCLAKAQGDDGPPNNPSSARGSPHTEALVARREALVLDLFNLHDLNKNGVLEEEELIKLNEKIAMLHYGKDTDKDAIRTKFRDLFRAKLDPNGQPVPFETFRTYMLETLFVLDRDPRAQDLIMDQFIAEAQSGIMCFHCKSFESITDAPFRQLLEPGSDAAIAVASAGA
eukprot:TRINITY_DN4284_c0_g1_i1.p1 TRINITY_DN4284_c0_g1~~TRINITY_DN4284_c0_g1_i1.p1  ORF type:complete len:225 (+),score=32.84 TRINITY_DN4284_c0_g1_i1:65-739(+)